MNPNLKWKALFILLVILGCIYGLVGLPTFPTSVAQLKDNFSHQIKLGLDLQGGTHLVLQVQDAGSHCARDRPDGRAGNDLAAWQEHLLMTKCAALTIRTSLCTTWSPRGSRNFAITSISNSEMFGICPLRRAIPPATCLRSGRALLSQIQETTMTQSLETIEQAHQRPRTDRTHYPVAWRPQ